MERRAHHLLVGLFVVGLTLALVVVALWLGRWEDRRDVARYTVYFEESVTGLSVDGFVRYNGIPVGRVARLDIDEGDNHRVRALIEVQRGTPITADTRASVELFGVTGVAYVQILGGMDGSPTLPERTEPPYPVILSQPSSFARVVRSAPELIARVTVLVDRVSALFSGEAARDLHDAVGGVADTARSLAALADELRGLHVDLSRTLRDVRAMTRSLSAVAGEVEGVLADSRAPLRDLLTTGSYQLTELLARASELVLSLSRVASQLERNPRRFLFGGPPRGPTAR